MMKLFRALTSSWYRFGLRCAIQFTMPKELAVGSPDSPSPRNITTAALAIQREPTPPYPSRV